VHKCQSVSVYILSFTPAHVGITVQPTYLGVQHSQAYHGRSSRFPRYKHSIQCGQECQAYFVVLISHPAVDFYSLLWASASYVNNTSTYRLYERYLLITCLGKVDRRVDAERPRDRERVSIEIAAKRPPCCSFCACTKQLILHPEKSTVCNVERAMTCVYMMMGTPALDFHRGSGCELSS
jgi:hypothetical protein